MGRFSYCWRRLCWLLYRINVAHFFHIERLSFLKKSALLQGSSRAWFGRFHVIGAFLLNKYPTANYARNSRIHAVPVFKDFLPYKFVIIPNI